LFNQQGTTILDVFFYDFLILYGNKIYLTEFDIPDGALIRIPFPLSKVKADYEAAGLEDFELFWDNKPMNTMRKAGLLVV
jgi:hypothetical protein